LTTFEQIVSTKFKGQKIIAQCLFDKNSLEKKLLQNAIKPNTDILILIGPEGGFSDKEIHSALKNGFVPVSLGNNRLRTETAGIIAVHTIEIINNR
jgi:16S rRNA (uracil1498-N3)-methyltransferase